ncbi:hypothetical protein SELMODRAFT_418229 [Selaginella moellendorffii]|uniref:Myb-like domain-containing protein n=1 Tax=Selaginella moellendorffii TaxID=88036 RepID=D8S529_SELML|nr:trihelix transcription factor ASR3 [Selaginella moellendorffii]EFJ20529.1 hypothetical protein SELMODRAFT_418229 [Selaginella moellendorffii]|eukprot:XP_002978543.1 trihelix transcription factor ASR3 [Selaginella moellendorffii]
MASPLVELVEASQAGFGGSEVIVGDAAAHKGYGGVGGGAARNAGDQLSGKRKRNRNWTHSEVLLLIEGKKMESEATIDTSGASCLSRDKMVISSGEKWKRVVDHMKRNGIDDRDVAQCKGKWDNLLSDYKTIKGVLKKSGRPNYFAMSIEERRREDPSLPCYFDKDLFDRLDSFLSGRLAIVSPPPPAQALDHLSTSAQSTRAGKGDHDHHHELAPGSSGKKKRQQSASDVVAAIGKLTSTYMAAVASMEEKREARHREALQFERERLQIESRDRRELAAQLANLAVALNRVADNLKDI